MRKLLLLVAILAVMIGGWYYASPLIAARSLQQAAMAGDEQGLADNVDFPAVRASLKDQLRPLIEREGERLAGASVLRQLAPALAAGMAERAVDEMVTPRGLAAVIAQGRANPLAGSVFAAGAAAAGAPRNPPEWEVERHGMNAFSLIAHDEEGRLLPELQFARRGLSWKLVGIDFQPAPR